MYSDLGNHNSYNSVEKINLKNITFNCSLSSSKQELQDAHTELIDRLPNFEKQIFKDFANLVPTTTWHENGKKIVDEIRKLEKLSRLPNALNSDDLSKLNESKLNQLINELKNHETTASTCQIVYENINWIGLTCYEYVFDLLRRDDPCNYPHYSDCFQIMIDKGYLPVKIPKDFDVVLYFNIQDTKDINSEIHPMHWGMMRDGFVISKDIGSTRVLKHPLYESSLWSTHIIFFRHSTGNPSFRPLPMTSSMRSKYCVIGNGVGIKKEAVNVLELGFFLIISILRNVVALGELFSDVTKILYSKLRSK
jgi:hypothetical protein